MAVDNGFSKSELEPPQAVKAINNHVVLIPEPTASPDDPLNWSTSRKIKLLTLLCFAAFCANVAPLSGQLAYPVQTENYGVSTIESSYSVSAAISGLAVGAFFFLPLAQFVGRWSITFWSLLGCLACAVWSARMTAESDYIPFIISRLISGLLGAVPSAVGGGIILDLFFLHQRGRAFICYEIAVIFGATAGPTFGGFIVGTTSWPICFWWTVPLLAIAAIAVLLFAEETHFDRSAKFEQSKTHGSFVKSRIALFFPGTAAVTKPDRPLLFRNVVAPFLIAASPATFLTGVFTLIIFGWLLLNDILGPTFLQNPPSEGGYGFTPVQNAAFLFSTWFGMFGAVLLGCLVGDRIPLWICKRFHRGVWRPELRLWSFLLSLVLTPIGMGISGAALFNHYHYMAFAVGNFVVVFSAVFASPIAANYVAESFTRYGSECILVMTFYRLAWGVAIPFFADKWIAEVGINWVYGIAAFITLASFGCVGVLLWKGPRIRSWTPMKSLTSSEDGRQVFDE